MLANFLNKSKPINFIGLLIFFFIAFLYSVFFEGFSSDKLIKGTISLIFFLIIFFLYNFIVSKNKLTLDNTYAFFLFTLFTINILSELIDYKTLSLTIIYLLFIRKIYSLRSPKRVLEKVFDSGFWLGVFFILEPFSILFLLLIYSGIFLHKKITIHTLLTPIVGFITPLIIYFAYSFWFDKTANFTSLFDFEVNFDLFFYSKTKYDVFTKGVLLCSICAIIVKSINALSVNNTFRRSWVLLILNFFILIFFLLFLPQKNGSELIFILFPISIILANGIELIKKKVIKNLVLYLLLLSSIAIHFIL